MMQTATERLPAAAITGGNTSTRQTRTVAVRGFLERPLDAAGLGVFRILFGVTMLFSTVRFVANGWVETLLIEPAFHFSYFGFRWVALPEGAWVYGLFALMAVSAVLLALGVISRASALVYFLAFTWVELGEKALYLNHYYLVSLLALLLAFLPCDRAYALRPAGRERTVPAWTYGLLRTQIGLVYFFAGLAKLNTDWLSRGEPLATWLFGLSSLPMMGPLLALPSTAIAMSWAGMLYDLTIWIGLSYRPTRRIAFVTVIAFHLTVGALFPIGVFPWVMIGAATVFFDPCWPRRFLGSGDRRPVPAASALPARPRLWPALCVLWLAVQFLLPVRHTLYPGNSNWTGEGFRFAWRVMLVEKTGQIEFRVVESGREHTVYPCDELAPFQCRVLPWEPDMILEYAHHIAETSEPETAVYADAWVSWNGRPSARLLDPEIDLASEHSTLLPAQWIVQVPKP
ncbi:MAG: hypothetical protein ACJAYU_004710 [Bradymonadia bacterium]|jgi:hypothetical protein